PRSARSTLFPYPTLFRSLVALRRRVEGDAAAERDKRAPAAAGVLRRLGRCADRGVPGAWRGHRRRRDDRAEPPEPTGELQLRERSEEHTSELQSPDHLVC